MRKSKDIKKLKVKAAQEYKKGNKEDFRKIWESIHKQYADRKNSKKGKTQ